jgi:tRNA (guanine-N7-)-methyltransferase
MRLKSKPWAKPLIAEHPEFVSTDSMSISPQKGFLRHALEIGTGKGDFIVGKSEKQKDTFFYGIERVTTVIAFALKKVLNQQSKNIRLILGEFAKASFHIPDSLFDEIYLNFSDPWPKIRHHKRRLTALGNLEKIHRILKPSGVIFLKTDNLELFEFSLLNLQKMSYNVKVISRPYVKVDPDDVITEYETFFREKGQPIYRCIAQRSEDVKTI